MLAIARAGAQAGCTEALFTLGDKPELRYRAAREALAELGYPTTIAYLAAMCALVFKETGLLPHVNPGVMTGEEIASLARRLRQPGDDAGIASPRGCANPAGPHYGSPDKQPARRLETIRLAGELQRALHHRHPDRHRRDAGGTDRLAASRIRDLHAAHGHIQEVIVQNFRAKPGTKMAGAAEPDLDDLLWTHRRRPADPRPDDEHVQAPPNLSPGVYPRLIAAGINDWGGVSPVTPDHVNPEAPWPAIAALAEGSAQSGRILVPRLPVYPAFAFAADRWCAPKLAAAVRRGIDSDGFAREDDWAPGRAVAPPIPAPRLASADPAVMAAVGARRRGGIRLNEADIVRLFAARDADYAHVTAAADALRRAVSGETVRYVVNRNINYTNICYYRCKFCAFSKGKTHEALRGTPYDLDMEEIVRRAVEAWDRGATEVCLQGGIHPDYTGATYLGICRAIKAALPGMHIHAFSPLEVTQGAATLGITVPAFLAQLKAAGLGTLPGTAAEILDDRGAGGHRARQDHDRSSGWMWCRRRTGSGCAPPRPSCTAMWNGRTPGRATCSRCATLQAETGGFTEFVPLPFVHMEAPMYLRGLARKGPTFREAVLMHAVSRLVLHPLIPNIQTSWVKMGPEGVAACLQAGANDLGGTLMNESISRAAGTEHGQEFPPRRWRA